MLQKKKDPPKGKTGSPSNGPVIAMACTVPTLSIIVLVTLWFSLYIKRIHLTQRALARVRLSLNGDTTQVATICSSDTASRDHETCAEDCTHMIERGVFFSRVLARKGDRVCSTKVFPTRHAIFGPIGP